MTSLYDEARAGLGDLSGAEGLLAGLARPERLTALIAELLARPEDLAECARWSFPHILGFEKLVLIAAPPVYMLRLHIWRPGGEGGLRHIHNHRADIISAVVRGRLEKQLFDRSASGLPLTEYREENDGRSWRLRLIGPAALERGRALALAGGAVYRLPARALHLVSAAPDETTMTLFMESRKIRETTEVFTPVDDPVPAARVPKAALTVAAFRGRLEAALAGLSGH